MKRGGVVLLFCGLLILVLTGSVIALVRTSDVAVKSASPLPSMEEAKALLNSTHRHPDWIQVPAGSTTILASVAYPDRADKAAVIIITAPDQPHIYKDATHGFLEYQNLGENARATIKLVPGTELWENFCVPSDYQQFNEEVFKKAVGSGKK